MKRGKVNITTLGCSKNLVDSEVLVNQLDLNGFEVAQDSDKDDANIVILNTCGFIESAKEESINTILGFAEARKAGKLDRLIVMGCLSARYKDDLEKEIPEVDNYYGKFEFKKIMKDLNADFFEQKLYRRAKTKLSHFAYLKISEGCNRHCSFCAIPQFTGIHKSRSIESLLEEAADLVANGAKELLIVAQDLSYYGIDRYGESRLAELLEKLSEVEGVEWIRLHYAYPTKFPLNVLDVMRNNPKICNYLDIPLQHASDHMLGVMRRKITKEQTINLIKRIREDVPGIVIRTTYLVGHPGETEEDFQELKQFIQDYPVERMGSFTFSNEEDTYAYKMYKDDVPEEVKEKRAAELMEIQSGITAKWSQAQIGKTLKVLIDREEEDYYCGRTEYDSPEVDGEVLVTKDEKLSCGEFYQIKITDASDFDLYGSLAD